jgi:hypothetical protein
MRAPTPRTFIATIADGRITVQLDRPTVTTLKLGAVAPKPDPPKKGPETS